MDCIRGHHSFLLGRSQPRCCRYRGIDKVVAAAAPSGSDYSSSVSSPDPYGNSLSSWDDPSMTTGRVRVHSAARRQAQSAWTRHLKRPYDLQPEHQLDLRKVLKTEYGNKVEAMQSWSAVDYWWQKLRYQYFIWRRDAWNDLQVFASVNLAIVLFGGAMKRALGDYLSGAGGTAELVQNTYQVGVLMFGNSFPDNSAQSLEQAFSLVIAALGIGSFAISLALVEQVVLENLDYNVRRGSKVYEKGHLVVLMWGTSQRDLEVTQTILQQACVAYMGCGGNTVVVLSQRPKVEMEEYFMSTVPYEERKGTKLVFRQGSPLDAVDLENVSAQDAYAIIVVSDCSRTPDEADAQTLRCAVLLDELGYPGPGVPDTRHAIIIAELKTLDALPLLQFSCSPRVVGFPTNLTNARSLCRLVHNPITAFIQRVLWDFTAQAQAFIQPFPQLQGVTFGELHAYFPDAIVVGLLRGGYGRLWISPPPDTVLGPLDDIMLCRPSAAGTYKPLEQPVILDTGDWDPLAFYQPPPPIDGIMGYESFNGVDGSGLRSRDDSSGSFDACMPCAIPPGYFDQQTSSRGVLICGWGESSMMSDMLRELDHGPNMLQEGSLLTLYNEHSSQEVLDVCRAAGVRALRIDHQRGDPANYALLASKVDMSAYRCAIVLCDINWMDPDKIGTNGIEMHKQHDMMRLDSLILTIQLNIRRLLKQQGLPEINIICERLSKAVQLTRFEDQVRMPMGISINVATYSARLLMQVAYNPQVMFPLFQFGRLHAIEIRDVSCLAYKGERLSWWQLIARASLVSCILVGYYDIPGNEADPMKMVINPLGDVERSKQRVWNKGTGRRKLLMVCPRSRPLDKVSMRKEEVDMELKRMDSSEAAGADVDGQLARFSRYRLSLSMGPKESRRLLREIHAESMDEPAALQRLKTRRGVEGL